MKSRCTKEELVRHIKRLIKKQYETKADFAESCGQTAQNLNAAMYTGRDSLPSWLIQRVGYRKTVIYEKIKYPPGDL